METPIHAIMVSVDYTDILKLTLPYNRHHFATVTVVTSREDFVNVEPVAFANKAKVYVTDAFYANGARFNKWAALEEALDNCRLRNVGWLCLMDADVLWPKVVDLDRYLRPGFLYTPMRRMYPIVPPEVPDEELWKVYPVHRNEMEFAGYSQVFHTSDKVLGSAPWHEINWKHAGGADSFFQARWPRERKVRPAWQCLHLGPAGTNWCGRASHYADGTIPTQAGERYSELRNMLQQRRRQGPGLARYEHERLTPRPQEEA